MTIDYGTDLWGADDLDPLMSEINDGRDSTIVMQAIYRRLITPRGGLIDDPDYGLCVQDWIEGGMTAVELSQLPGVVANEIQKDDRVVRAIVAVRQLDARTIALDISGEIAGGPFAMVVSVSPSAVLLEEMRTL
jgi:hypothetical protein